MSMAGAPVLIELTELCKSWLIDNDIEANTADEKVDKTKKGKLKNQLKSKAGKKNKVVETEDKFVKKPSMKTAADVIKRLQWDESVEKDDFIVGYIDRIVGLVEKRFTAFSWEDLASVDYMTLAIPQHRIQYFKYKTEKVWDKNERLDNVFGSAGNSLTITEAIAKYDKKEQENVNSLNNKDSDSDEDDGACPKNINGEGSFHEKVNESDSVDDELEEEYRDITDTSKDQVCSISSFVKRPHIQ